MIDVSRHPCFNEASPHTFGRVHLPITPRRNVQWNSCSRRYDCVSELRLGVTSGVFVATHEGFLVNRHLGQPDRLRVYQPRTGGDWQFSGIRQAPPAG